MYFKVDLELKTQQVIKKKKNIIKRTPINLDVMI